MSAADRLLGVAIVLAMGCQGPHAYDECFTAGDCPGEAPCALITSGDRLCSRGCTTDLDCPLDRRQQLGACVRLAGGGSTRACFAVCNGRDDCSAGQACLVREGRRVCLPERAEPTAPHLAPCTVASGCLETTDACLTSDARGNALCTLRCSADVDCAGSVDAFCTTLSGTNPRLCIQGCAIDDDCRAGLTCRGGRCLASE